MTRRFGTLMDGGFPYVVAVVEGRVSDTPMPALTVRGRPTGSRWRIRSICNLPSTGGNRATVAARLMPNARRRGYRQMIAVIGDSANAASIAFIQGADLR